MLHQIGDCYVAVTGTYCGREGLRTTACLESVQLTSEFCALLFIIGLPKPSKKHALVMVLFAGDCLEHIGKVTKSLADSLGQDTNDLKMRVGLHSGPGEIIINGLLSQVRYGFRQGTSPTPLYSFVYQ